jgi:protein SCO1
MKIALALAMISLGLSGFAYLLVRPRPSSGPVLESCAINAASYDGVYDDPKCFSADPVIANDCARPANHLMLRWSDAAAWGGSVPQEGAHVVIPEGRIVILDASPPPLASLKIYGALLFENKSLVLEAGSLVLYGTLQVGSPKVPHTAGSRLILNEGLRKASGLKEGLLMQGGRVATYPKLDFITKASYVVPGQAAQIKETNQAAPKIFWYGKEREKHGGDFVLKDKNGHWRFTDHSKGVNIFYVGYVKCPDVCPLTLAYLGQAVAKLSDPEKQNLQVLFLSVDQEHDTPEGVATFASQFSPGFVGLTGTREQIDSAVNLIGASYNITEEKNSRLGYTVGHSDRLFVLDKNGIVLRTEADIRSVDSILKLLKEVL